MTQYQNDYNSLDVDLRALPGTKAELLLRVEELRDGLWDVCDHRHQENEKQFATVKWVVGQHGP